MNKIVMSIVAAAFTSAPAMAPAMAKQMPAGNAYLARSFAAPQARHQFRQVMLPTGEPNAFRVGLWILNPSTGKVRLCLLDDESTKNAMKCSPWLGGDSPGKYRVMHMNVPRHMSAGVKAGLWIVNYETGAARACVIGDLMDPTGTLSCARSR